MQEIMQTKCRVWSNQRTHMQRKTQFLANNTHSDHCGVIVVYSQVWCSFQDTYPAKVLMLADNYPDVIQHWWSFKVHPRNAGSLAAANQMPATDREWSFCDAHDPFPAPSFTLHIHSPEPRHTPDGFINRVQIDVSLASDDGVGIRYGWVTLLCIAILVWLAGIGRPRADLSKLHSQLSS